MPLRRILLVIAALAAIGGAAYANLGFLAWGEVDSCLDHGGCWDHVDAQCRQDELKALELCNRGRDR